VNVAEVATELADLLSEIDDLRVYDFPPDQVAPPAAYVEYPETISYDVTHVRGTDMATFTVYVVVDRNSDRATTEKLYAYAEGSGADSVKAALEVKPYSAFSTCHVQSARFVDLVIAGVDLRAVAFTVVIHGSGA